MHIFTYGSLMFAPVWNRIVRGIYQSSEGRLPGYIRRAVIGEHYPVVLKASADKQVPGIVYLDIDDDDMTRLDVFEGGFYERREEEILLPDGARLRAGVYVLREKHRAIAADFPWDPERFREHGMRLFLDGYRGFETVEQQGMEPSE